MSLETGRDCKLEREGGKDNETDHGGLCVCVCVCLYLYTLHTLKHTSRCEIESQWIQIEGEGIVSVSNTFSEGQNALKADSGIAGQGVEKHLSLQLLHPFMAYFSA